MLLAADQHQPNEQIDCRLILASPYRGLTAEALLEYFQTRTTVHYFTVPDVVETARQKMDDLLQSRFEFNGEQHHLTPSIQWLSNPSRDKEWLILLHKFYYAVGLGMAYHETNDPRYATTWVDLTTSWIRTVPLDFLPSDVAGRRIQNWIFAHYYFVSTGQPSCVTPDFYLSFLQSLHDQISHLRNHVTPARNHRTLELCAIFLAAVVFPEFAESPAWLSWSKDELVKNIQSDLLSDGVHCEQSTDYHHLVLKNYLWVKKLARINRIQMPEEFDAPIQKALDFSLYCHRPDGMIPALSDGDSRCFLDLLQQGYELFGGEDLRYVASRGAQGQPPALRSKQFSHSGYSVLRSGWGDQGEPYEDERYLIFDCGPLGMGNHGHLDLLNFEAYAYGTPLIIDPGRYTYDESGPVNWRVRFRGTAAHNTVLVDGRNQTRYEWKKNRYKISGPEPDRESKALIHEPGLDYLHAVARSHEYPVIHERKVLFINREYWVIVDLLRATESHTYDLLFHLSPPAQDRVSVMVSDNTLSIHSPQLILAQPLIPNVRPSIQEGFVSRVYGEKQRAPIVQLTQHDSNTCFFTILYPYKGDKPFISVKTPEPDRRPQSLFLGERASAQITIAHNGRGYTDEVVLTDEAAPAFEAPDNASPKHVRVSRTNHERRLLFQYQA